MKTAPGFLSLFGVLKKPLGRESQVFFSIKREQNLVDKNRFSKDTVT